MHWTELRTGEAHVFLWMGEPVTGILIENAFEDRTWYTFRTRKSSLKVPLEDVVSLASPDPR